MLYAFFWVMKMKQKECSEMLAYKIQHREITQKKAYNLTALVC